MFSNCIPAPPQTITQRLQAAGECVHGCRDLEIVYALIRFHVEPRTSGAYAVQGVRSAHEGSSLASRACDQHLSLSLPARALHSPNKRPFDGRFLFLAVSSDRGERAWPAAQQRAREGRAGRRASASRYGAHARGGVRGAGRAGEHWVASVFACSRVTGVLTVGRRPARADGC